MIQPWGYWRSGRAMPYDPDRQAIEQERQRWVYEQITSLNEAIVDLAVDPDREYARLRSEYEATGNLGKLYRALDYVRELA
jgi:hypothetical protein